MPKPTLLLKNLLPLESTNLGNLVLYPDEPSESYYEPPSECVSKTDVLTQHIEQFTYILEQTKGSSIHAFFASLFDKAYSYQKTSRVDISACLCITRQLKNVEAIFREICEEKGAKRWLEDAMRRRKPVFMVSGIKTLINAKIQKEKLKSSEIGGQVGFPTDIALASTGVVVPLPDIFDIGAGVSTNEESRGYSAFSAPGEQIFAVQYREIKLSKSLGKTESTVVANGAVSWKFYVEVKGTEDEVPDSHITAYLSEYQPDMVPDTSDYNKFPLEDEDLWLSPSMC
ncbi:hypothetical protein ABW19_dt0202497 [Dactylella cylindrospora]|nr:hypothetical protein ABW19_dt0202497 [Dactylella cylindrospora]